MKTDNRNSKKVVISGYYGFNNFGDEAILHILVRELKKKLQPSEIVVFSKTPRETTDQLAVRSVDRMKLFQVFNEIKNSKMLISGGGSLLQDVTGPLTIFYYLLIIYMAQICNVKTFIYSQGIGPINRKISKYFTKKVLGKATYTTVRDENSLRVLNELGLNAELTCDPVWLGFDDTSETQVILDELNIKPEQKYLGVNIRSWPMISTIDIQELASVINYVAEKEQSAVLILSLQKDKDLSVSTDLYQILLAKNPSLEVILVDKSYPPEIWNQIIKSCDRLIAMRLHALMCAIKNDVKVYGLSYDPKVKTLLDKHNKCYSTVEQWREKKLFDNIKLWLEKTDIDSNDQNRKLEFNLATKTIENIFSILNNQQVETL